MSRAAGPSVVSEGGDDFLSGTGGHVTGIRASSRAVLADGLDVCASMLRLRGPRLDRRARATAPRRVLVLAVERRAEVNLLAAAHRELLRSHHRVDFRSIDVGDQGKFENLNRLLAENPPWEHDWLLVIDDDVSLPRNFLDRFLLLCEQFELKLAQPAHRHRSNAAWRVTRRRRLSLVRETAFVEIGPVTAFHRESFETLLPFPALRMGWGLDAHWSAVALSRGWQIGVVDATAMRHDLRPAAAAYDTSTARAEAREFLRHRPYVKAGEAQRTLRMHSRLPKRPTRRP